MAFVVAVGSIERVPEGSWRIVTVSDAESAFVFVKEWLSLGAVVGAQLLTECRLVQSAVGFSTVRDRRRVSRTLVSCESGHFFAACVTETVVHMSLRV